MTGSGTDETGAEGLGPGPTPVHAAARQDTSRMVSKEQLRFIGWGMIRDDR